MKTSNDSKEKTQQESISFWETKSFFQRKKQNCRWQKSSKLAFPHFSLCIQQMIKWKSIVICYIRGEVSWGVASSKKKILQFSTCTLVW